MRRTIGGLDSLVNTRSSAAAPRLTSPAPFSTIPADRGSRPGEPPPRHEHDSDRRVSEDPDHDRRRPAPVRGHSHPGPHPRAGRPVLHVPARRPRSGDDQDRGARPGRHRPPDGVRPDAQPAAHGHRVPHPGREQALPHPRPQGSAGPGDPEAAGGRRRRAGGELPGRGDGGARPRLRGSPADQPAPHLLLDDRLRPGRPQGRGQRLRLRHPGHLGPDEHDRLAGDAAGEDGRAGHRLRERPERGLRGLVGAVPAGAHRAGGSASTARCSTPR